MQGLLSGVVSFLLRSPMKVACVLFALVAILVLPCPGQELKTVAECRAYREAWLTSADGDTARLTVRELHRRAEQMIVCGKKIDGEPFKEGMTQREALDAAIAGHGYLVLASAYDQEAFNRAIWFIDNKHLTGEFITADKNGTIRREKR